MAKRVISKRLGQLLIERGVIDKKQLSHALKLQTEKGGLVGNILVYLGYATEEAIAQAITADNWSPSNPCKLANR